jgi:hypothetical protein
MTTRKGRVYQTPLALNVSEPVRQPNGYYIRGESVSAMPFTEVRDQIFTKIQQVKMAAWMETTTKDLKIKHRDD